MSLLVNQLSGFGASSDEVVRDPADLTAAFLCHFDGADTTTSFVDEKGRTMTANGNAQHDDAQSKFGGRSLLLDGAGDYVNITYHSSLLLGTGAFGIDFWIRLAGNQTNKALFSNRTSVGNATAFHMRIGSTQNTVNMGAGDGTFGHTTAALSNGVWYHIYMGRSGTTFYYGLDGTLTTATVSNDFSSTNDIRIGSDPFGDSGQFNGHIDEVRMIIGATPWTANFTPVASPWLG